MNKETEKDVLRVLALHGARIDRNLEKANATATKADAAIGDAEVLLEKLGKAIPERNRHELEPLLKEAPRLRTWEEIVAGARVEQSGEITFADILSSDEMAAATSRLSLWKSEFAGLHQLTHYDYAVAGAAGIFAGLADIFLVQIPEAPWFFGRSRR